MGARLDHVFHMCNFLRDGRQGHWSQLDRMILSPSRGTDSRVPVRCGEMDFTGCRHVYLNF